MRARIVMVAAGLALAATAEPALAATKTVRTRLGDTFSPATTFVRPGDTVRFVNSSGGEHNVAWRGAAFPTQPNPASFEMWTVLRTFPTTTPNRTFGYFCTVHANTAGTEGMIGRVVVDRTPPTITLVSRTPGRSRVTLSFTSSEAGAFVGTVSRRSGRTFTTLGPLSFTVRRGTNTRVVTQTSEGRRSDRLTPGTYRITFRVRDPAGNLSSSRTVNFTITQR
jgi:plastocyanin